MRCRSEGPRQEDCGMVRVADQWRPVLRCGARVIGADGAKVDPDLPFTIFLARWDSGELRWATTETDDDMPY
jgi:hypothetical protein